MITLVSRETHQPASGASAASYARWDAIPQAYRETYARQGEEPTRGQSELFEWSGADEPTTTRHTLRVTIAAPVDVDTSGPTALLMAPVLGAAEIEGCEEVD